MEAAPGGTIHELVARPRLPLGWTATLARRLVDGLDAIYCATGGPHGDFQPGNVLVTSTLEPWFIDLQGMPGPGPASEWAALDIGTWAYKAVSRIPRPAAVLPYAVARHLRLARTLLEMAARRYAGGDVPAFRARAAAQARERLAALAVSEWPRDRLAAAAGSRLLPFALGSGEPGKVVRKADGERGQR